MVRIPQRVLMILNLVVGVLLLVVALVLHLVIPGLPFALMILGGLLLLLSGFHKE